MWDDVDCIEISALMPQWCRKVGGETVLALGRRRGGLWGLGGRIRPRREGCSIICLMRARFVRACPPEGARGAAVYLCFVVDLRPASWVPAVAGDTLMSLGALPPRREPPRAGGSPK